MMSHLPANHVSVFTIPTVTFRYGGGFGGNLMVWVGISDTDKTDLITTEGHINAE